MCKCDNKNFVDLQKIKIYLTMAKYEVKEKWLGKGLSSSFSDGNGTNIVISWDKADEKELALIYEEYNNSATNFINKIDKSSEKTNKKAKKPSKNDQKE